MQNAKEGQRVTLNSPWGLPLPGTVLRVDRDHGEPFALVELDGGSTGEASRRVLLCDLRPL